MLTISKAMLIYYLHMFEPVCGLQAGQPVGLLHVGVDDVLELLQGFPHDMDVLDVQEDELSVLILIALVASSRGLEITKALRLGL